MESVYRLVNPWWEGKKTATGVPRDVYLAKLVNALARRQIEVLVGSRRVGKTTLLRQVIAAALAAGVPPYDICYLPLDHPGLSSTPLSEHLRRFRRMFDHPRDRRLYLFLDEVQDSPGWEAEVKAIYDTERTKLFCSGSTSALVARQGGKLTGRQIVTTVFPLSFREFVAFRGDPPSLAEDYRYETLAADYLAVGGFPEHVLSPTPEYLANLLEDILARDLLRLFPIRKPAALKDLVRLVAAAVGTRTSFQRLSRILGVSVDTVKEYLGYLEAAYLVAPLEKWTTSLSERVYAARKLYLGDTGIKTVLTGAGDEGSRAENAVFMEFRRRGVTPGYFAESEREVDFIVGSQKEPLPIEVKLVDRLDLADRRFGGLRLFLRRHPRTRRALVITRTAAAAASEAGTEIEAVPLWSFLLDSARYAS